VKSHLLSSANFCLLQSAYRVGHSTATALLRLVDDVYQKIDNKLPTVIVGLDISAAFDMVNHETLLDHLRNAFGTDGKVLAWLESYLSSRQQFVKIGQHTSNTCQCGVPRGSVLGPLLFSVYTSPIGEVVSKFGVHFHQFADDMQIYLALSDTSNNLVTLDQCTNAVKA